MQSLAVDIEGAIAFPFMRSYGTLKMQINNTGLAFKAELVLFQGAVKNIGAEVSWKWDMSSFVRPRSSLP